MSAITIPVRYYRLCVNPGVSCEEKNFEHRELTWLLPTEQTALVLVDCWDIHYIKSHEQRSCAITRERIAPLMAACRQAGMTIVHAPSPPIAKKYAQWVRYAGDGEFGIGTSSAPSDWPPPEFRRREGEYEQFRKPHEPVMDEWNKIEGNRRIIAEIEPHGNDFVIATGAQLHRLCRDRKILHLLYAGFAANMCVLYRDYGMRAMRDRGYNVILLRDCTTAIEAHETLDDELLTKAAILEIEMTVGYSTTSQAVMDACFVRLKDTLDRL